MCGMTVRAEQEMPDFVRHRPAQQLGVVDVGALRHHPDAVRIDGGQGADASIHIDDRRTERVHAKPAIHRAG